MVPDTLDAIRLEGHVPVARCGGGNEQGWVLVVVLERVPSCLEKAQYLARLKAQMPTGRAKVLDLAARHPVVYGLQLDATQVRDDARRDRSRLGLEPAY